MCQYQVIFMEQNAGIKDERVSGIFGNLELPWDFSIFCIV